MPLYTVALFHESFKNLAIHSSYAHAIHYCLSYSKIVVAVGGGGGEHGYHVKILYVSISTLDDKSNEF